MANGYTVTIKESTLELTARERIILKDTTNAIKLDNVVEEGKNLVITPTAYAVLAVHNENSVDKDYEQYLIIGSDGTKYVTGSSSFIDAFVNIWSEMRAETDDAFDITVYKVPSKNRPGKYFLSCSLI